MLRVEQTREYQINAQEKLYLKTDAPGNSKDLLLLRGCSLKTIEISQVWIEFYFLV